MDRGSKSSESSYHSTWAQEVELEAALENAARNGATWMDDVTQSPEITANEGTSENGIERMERIRPDRTVRQNGRKQAEDARKVEQRRTEGQKKIAEEKTREEKMHGKMRMNLKDDRTVKQGMSKIRKWFGIETDSESEKTDTDTDTEDWNIIDRKKHNKMKKKLQDKKRKDKQSLNAQKAGHILGLAPIHPETIQANMTNSKSYEEAKVIAVKEYLNYYLKFNEEELDEMQLGETKTAAKGDKTMYVAFKDKEHIREIHQRMAECRNPELSTRNYIPPGFHARYMAVNKKCTETRQKFTDTKTQLRFGDHDIEVLTKERGTEEPYRSVELDDFMDGTQLPPFDHSKKWSQRTDRPPRRKINYGRQSEDPLTLYKPTNKHQLSRQNSTEEPKRQRGEGIDIDNMETEIGSSSQQEL